MIDPGSFQQSVPDRRQLGKSGIVRDDFDAHRSFVR
jgi:hypothetical protein